MADNQSYHLFFPPEKTTFSIHHLLPSLLFFTTTPFGQLKKEEDRGKIVLSSDTGFSMFPFEREDVFYS